MYFESPFCCKIHVEVSTFFILSIIYQILNRLIVAVVPTFHQGSAKIPANSKRWSSYIFQTDGLQKHREL
ncbi:hypothetical protein FFZ99_10250 [Leptospira interrogans]|nr:hypothetical protein LEP1GSC045_2574 [Leptospira interrogans serovar Pomona str. Kennewicki LC82-25]EKN99570.1 hypothetical protein LEP1GSC014_3067 [Leptospira interrogans serovar Pomona str. Pomona]EMN41085.1 hypothetical protein LEP1GSC085_3774 [Leptospira interrogans str. L0996]OMH73034.1 hypothetical protein BW243_02030 [Leptospira interrogans serovar Pomona]TQE57679.1 hypothetical protein FF006_10065 [Leptospira interrogans]